jgi:pimeloyl-ACP methyl ester carboxylesterase
MSRTRGVGGVACRRRPPTPEEAPVPIARADGLQIAYDAVGEGEPALLCLTGWCSSRARYSEFVPLAAEHRRVVAFDWRGHGPSDRHTGDFRLEGQVRDARAVVDAARLERFVTVSASHSGWVALELRRQLGERVAGMVFIDWMLVEPSPAYTELVRSLTEDARWEEARDTLLTIWRGGVDRPAVDDVLAVMRAADADMWKRSGREITAAYEAAGSPFAALEQLTPAPTALHLYGQPLDRAYLAAQERFAAEHPWFAVRRLDGRTHFTMTECAAEAAELVERFAAVR